jgi:hypothetical protein
MRFTVAVVGFIIATVTRRSPIRFIARRRFRAIGPSGYALNEWSRDGMQFGQDSGGRRWMIWRWRGIETTTVTSLPVALKRAARSRSPQREIEILEEGRQSNA